MSELRVYREDQPARWLRRTLDEGVIALALRSIGVAFERWPMPFEAASASPAEVLSAYKDRIERHAQAGTSPNYVSADVVSMVPDHPDRQALREKFLREHRHTEEEVRVFVRGRGLFALHVEGLVHEVLCTERDSISVPGGTRHWFDMGPAPDFVAIRLFQTVEGWVADYTGDDIARRFSRLENWDAPP